jgi:hypothetical protein
MGANQGVLSLLWQLKLAYFMSLFCSHDLID